ncbi:MAG: SusD/RagB family nutrient-binding outer membrane lipoprotein [Lewinella sp.]|nr:SusD/RagB family nutrient-binding outer membrane lipoprotein [Lewinella sp.]
MKNIFKLSFLALLALAFSGCDNLKLEELLDNPNEVTPDRAELDLVFNAAMLDFKDFVDEVSDETMPYVRMTAMDGGFFYLNQDSPTSFDFLWGLAYADILPDLNLIIDNASDPERGLTTYSGIAKTMKAYVLFTLVDLFGDVPYSEALQGVTNPNPKADDDDAVYAAAKELLESALADFASPKGSLSDDLYFDGTAAAWEKLANTLLIRYHVNTRRVGGSGSAIDAIVSTGKIIDASNEDFQFQYGTNRNLPDSRHPYYSDGYENGGPSWYMSNYMMWQMFGDKNNEDPRLRYYFRRQDGFEDNENQFTLDCTTAPYPSHWPDGYPWCTASGDYGDPDGEYGGYWGRSHGNADGIPPDDLKRTAWGLYPGGGAFDNLPKVIEDEDVGDDTWQVSNAGTDGARGAGIQPIFLSSWTHFMLAEAALTMGTSGDARALFETGMRQSISKVMNFNTSVVDNAFVPSAADVDAYVNEVLARYDGAVNDEARLDIVMNECRLACHGNGLEPFNGYRRTGYPSGMEPKRENDPNDHFPRTLWYPSDFVNLNSSISQRPNVTTDRVFWDTLPGDLD